MKEIKAGMVNVKTGRDFTVVSPSNLYGCEFGDHCFVGPFVEVQQGVKVGNRTRIQSHSFVCELVEIGDDCFIGHGVVFINDLFANGGPARGNKTLWKPTRIGNKVSVGSNATLLPVSICDNVVIGAGSVVVKDIKVSGVYAGNPARLIRKLS